MWMSSQPPPPNAARKPRRLMPAGHSFSMNARTSVRKAASAGVSLKSIVYLEPKPRSDGRMIFHDVSR